MNPRTVLQELSARGVRMVVRGDRLSIRGPEDVLTADVTERLRQHKTEILEAARRCPICIECGAAIAEPVTTWWGGSPAHYACGEAAWAREWLGETLPADAAAAT